MCFKKLTIKNFTGLQGASLILFIGGAVLCLWLLNFAAELKVTSRPIYNFADCLSAGYPRQDSYPARCQTPDGRMFIEKILSKHKVVSDIRVTQPTANQLIYSPLAITGEARGNWFFEASFPVRLIDGNGYILAERPAQAQSDWMTDSFVPFGLTLPFAVSSTSVGTLILKKDNPSALPENDAELRLPVRFAGSEVVKNEWQTVKIFLSDSRATGAPDFDCTKTVAVNREVIKTVAIGRAAIEALLRGATEQEIADGYVTSLPAGIRLNKISINQGVAKADFDEQLEYQMGGSCRVAAIQAQIVDTLKQFPSLEKVIISINGRTTDILQP